MGNDLWKRRANRSFLDIQWVQGGATALLMAQDCASATCCPAVLPPGSARSSLGGILQAMGTSLGPARRTCV